ncbi:MAG: hypothetical protein E6K72_13010, partial [Candidatus Eisenbacteria bacterium]
MSRRSGRSTRAAALALLLLLALARGGRAQPTGGSSARGPGRPPYSIGVTLSRAVVKLGERAIYRGWITGGDPARVRFLAPDSGGAFTWGPLRATVLAPHGKASGRDPAGAAFADFDTLFVATSLQAFVSGDLVVPGLAFELDDGGGPRGGRFPVARLVVVPMLTAADTSARLRGLRGPLAAPWWEMVPWTLVALVAAGVAVAVALALRRRRPATIAPAQAAARDPAAQALAELEALRRLGLPARARFAEHAFQLGRIVRRFLEEAAGTPLPGDTTPEFVGHLEAARLEAQDLQRIGSLMHFWDRVKFARA